LTYVLTRVIINIESEEWSMKTAELLKLLKKNKIEFVRHGKKHDIYYSPLTQQQFPVPRHKTEIMTGTLKSILEAAGLK